VRLNFEDRRLVDRLLQGEEAAFNDFFAQYFGRLFRFASTRLQDEEAARDIVQETLCRALRNLRSFRGEAALFTWLCQICRSQLSDYFEKHGRHAKRFVPIEDDPAIQAALELIAAPDADPAELSHRNEILRLVQVVLDRLPARYGNALEWKYVEGASVETIAERLGVQHAAAQSVLQRARQAFRALFEELYGATNVLQALGIEPNGASR
jgi:RNA polymerase sigma-70 factor (ECF subfamily)